VAQPGGFVPPPYPYDRIDELADVAAAHAGGAVDLSIGTPCDPPPPAVVEALARSGAERGYPASIGSAAYREAAAGWMARRLGIDVDPSHVAACVGTKELVAGLPQWLRLRRPDRDTVLYPAVSYPTYAMGAQLAGCRAVAYSTLEDVDPADAARALCLWVNVPGNPDGSLAGLGAAAAWGRTHEVPVLSDECYIEFTWDGPPRTILEHGLEGVLAVHSLSKRSNLAGVRAGCYAGDPDLVGFLSGIRRHAGFMVPGPVQAAAVVAWGDDAHVEEQRARYLGRLHAMRAALALVGVDAPLPAGSFYLWAPAPGGDAWAFTRLLAEQGGALVAPGELYGPTATDHVRVAVVQPDDRIALVAERLAAAAG
jgi:succinyldiaminopimelate transaminase